VHLSRTTTGVDAAIRELIALSVGLFPDALASAAASAVERHCGARDAVLFLVDLDQVRLVPLDPAGDHGPLPVDDSPAGLAFRREQAVVQRSELGRRLWLPVLDSAERLGVFGLVDDGETPVDDWLLLASFLGELVTSKEPYGDTIARARRSAPLTLAAEMRWSLLPPLTFTSEAVSVTGILQPSHLVAGDAFDYAVDAQTATVGLFDAMGHGLEASRIANVAIGGFRNARRCGSSVSETFELIDLTVADQFGKARFCTGQVATLHLETGTVRIHTAGHPPPLVLRTDSTVEEVAVRPGLPLGLGPSRYDEAVVQLAPGDALLIHSDGVTEARSPDDEEYGMERLGARASSLLADDTRPAEVLRVVMHEALDFQQGKVRDDATLVLLRWRPTEVDGPWTPVGVEPIELPG
jgi:hypothetical protein